MEAGKAGMGRKTVVVTGKESSGKSSIISSWFPGENPFVAAATCSDLPVTSALPREARGGEGRCDRHLTQARERLEEASAIVYVLKSSSHNKEDANQQIDDLIWKTFITPQNKARVVLLLLQDASWDIKLCSQEGLTFNPVEHYTAMDFFSSVMHVNIASGEGIRESFQQALESVQRGPRSVKQAIVKLGQWKITQTMAFLSSIGSTSKLPVPSASHDSQTYEGDVGKQSSSQSIVDQGSGSTDGWKKIKKFVQQKKYEIVELKPVSVEQASMQTLPVKFTGFSESRPASVKSTTSEPPESLVARSPSPAQSFSSDVSVEPPHALSESILQDMREEANRVILAQVSPQCEGAQESILSVKIPKLEEPRLFPSQRTLRENLHPPTHRSVKAEFMPEILSEREKYASMSDSETSARSRDASDRYFSVRTLSASTNMQIPSSGVSDGFRILLQIFPHRSAEVFELENLERQMQAIVTKYTK
eukprot:757934-Hanusia_phi.AAC.6